MRTASSDDNIIDVYQNVEDMFAVDVYENRGVNSGVGAAHLREKRLELGG